MITYPPGTTRRGQHIFPECVSEHAFGSWLPTKGELHKLLRGGEFDQIGDAPVFEGTFVQVTKRGEFVGILNHPNIVILGVLASTPVMMLPDLIIIARDKNEGKSKTRKLEIARLIPLELVEIYVHNLKERRLKIHMVTGRNYYLQLCAPDGEEGFQFERWMRLIYLLHLATGKVKAPSQDPSKDTGLHTIWKTASLPSETQSWLPAIMDKGSSEEMKKWSSHANSTQREQKSKQSAVASNQSPSKSGAAVRPSPQQPSGIVPSEAKREKRFGSRRLSSRSAPPTHASVAVGTSELASVSVGTGPSKPFTLSEAVGPSQPGSQLGAWASCQRKSIEQPGVSAAHEGVMSKDSIVTERESCTSGEIPVKLERSKKSRSLVQSTTSQLAQQKRSQSRSNAPDLEKSATEAQATSKGSSSSARPLTQGERSGLTSQSSSRKPSQPASRATSMRAPLDAVARSRMSAAVGSFDAYNKSVAVGLSEVGAVSVAAGPSKPASQASQAAFAKSKASQMSAFTDPQPTSHESRATPARSRTLDDPDTEEAEGAAGTGDMPVSREMSAKSKPSEKSGASAAASGFQSQGRASAMYSQMASMNMEPEGSAGTRPVSREMSAKSKPSEKSGASAAPSGFQSQSRASAPYSQTASMNMEPEGSAETRPVSREMSAKSKPSEKSGASAAPSRFQSQSKSSAPYSQTASMNMEPEGSAGTRPVSREMSAKSKPSEKSGASAAPSGFQSQSRASAPYSQMASMNMEPEGSAGTRPISREMSAKSKPSEKSGASAAASGFQSQGRASAPYSQMASMNMEPEGSAGTRPVSREMSAKSKPSEKSGASAAPSRFQSQSKSSAPYSQTASMNMEPEGSAGTRPVSREMSAKSKPSEKSGASAAPSGFQSQSRSSAPYSQTASMNMEPEESAGTRPVSREMSAKSKPSEKSGASAAPSGFQSQGRASAPYSQMASMNMEPEGSAGTRPVSREMSAKSKPSEKSGASAAASGFQSQGRASAPYSQMASMNMEPEGSAGTRPVSREMSVKSKPSEKPGASAAPSRQGRTSSPSSQLAGMEAQKAKSSKPLTSASPSRSPSPGRYLSPRPPGKTSKGGSHLYRTLVSVAVGRSEPGVKTVAVGPSKPFLGRRGKPPSRTPEANKSVKLRTMFSRNKSKSGDKTQPSSATEKQESSRDQTSKSKSRLKNALSSAKQRSSLTFVTIYSVLSSSMERLKNSKSKEEEEAERKQLLEEQLENVTPRSSKRVTISGVIGPSGKNAPTEEEEPLMSSEMNTLKADEIGSTTATLGSELPGNLSVPQSHTGTEPSASPQLDGSASNQILPSSRLSEKSALDKDAPTSPEVASLPPHSKISVDKENSTASTKPASADSSARRDQEEPSVQSRQQSEMGDGLRPSSQPSAVTSPPDRSRISVGVGRSVVGTKSEAVGPSVRGSFRDAAVGPSVTGSWKQQGGSRVQSRQQSRMEDRLRPSSQPSAVTRPPDRSRISVGVGRSIVGTQSEAVGPSVRGSFRDAAVGPSVTGSWKQQGESRAQSRQQSKTEDGQRPISQLFAATRPPDQSRVSVGVGRSMVETKSAAVGLSVVGSWNEQSEHSIQTRQQSQMVDDWRASSHFSAGPGPPDRSRMSVGVGRSIIETKSVGVGRSNREKVSEGAGPSKPGSMFIVRNNREPSTRLQGNSVFQPQGWLGTVETEEKPVFKATSSQAPRTAAASPGPSSGASRVVTPSGGVGSCVTKDASARC